MRSLSAAVESFASIFSRQAIEGGLSCRSEHYRLPHTEVSMERAGRKWTGTCTATGAAVGASVGVALDNIAGWIAIGAAVGVTVGLALDSARRK